MKNNLIEKYTKQHYWQKIGEIINMPMDKRDAEFQKWSQIFARDNPRFNDRVFSVAYNKALEDPSIVPNIAGGKRPPMARSYNPDSGNKGLYSQTEVMEIVKHVLREFKPIEPGDTENTDETEDFENSEEKKEQPSKELYSQAEVLEIVNHAISEVISTKKTNLQEKWRMPLQQSYGTLENWESYNDTYGLLDRINKNDKGIHYDTPEEAWEANPMLTGSTDPKEFGIDVGKSNQVINRPTPTKSPSMGPR